MGCASRSFSLGAACLVIAGALACQSPPSTVKEGDTGAAPAPQVAVDRSAPSMAELQRASYKGVEEAGGPFTLANGKWQGQPYEPGGASAPSVTLVRDLRLAGDLDADGREEAVVVLAGSTGGTGETSYVALVRRGGAEVENVATAAVGDRVQVRDAGIHGKRIVLDLVQAGANDPACCPGELVTRSWALQGNALVEGSPVATGRLSLEALAGNEWVLRNWAWDEPAPTAPEVTLALDGARLVGGAGCNNYFAPVKAGQQPGDLEVGPVGTTRKMCPDAAMAVEKRFTQQLAGVRQLRFTGGRLALPYAMKDNSFGAMLFERRRR
jgi:heat shock protein HslJ